jgi:integrase-like protein
VRPCLRRGPADPPPPAVRTNWGPDVGPPRTGRPFDAGRYGELLRLALKRAGIEEYVRPSHDLRHSSITNAAAAGTPTGALMSRSGHSSFTTTQRYIDLAGERFREEADRLEGRLWGASGTKTGYQNGNSSSSEEAAEPANPLPLLTAGVGFEPTRRLHAQRFSRPPRSTAPAPRRGHCDRR